MSARPWCGFAVGAALSLLAWSAAAQQAAPAAPAARMDGLSVSQQELEQMLRALPEAERAAVRADHAALAPWLRERLAREALLREARANRWAERPEVRSSIDAAVQEATARTVGNSYLASVAQVPAGYPSPDELRAAYAQARPGLAVPETFRVAQIFLALPAGADAAAVAALRAQAEALAQQARQGDFAALARQHSQDSASAARGGEIGLLPLERLLPQARESVAGMQAGQVAAPVQTSAGWHVLKLLERQPARTATLEEVLPRLTAVLRAQRQQALARAHLEKLAPVASVVVDAATVDAAVRHVFE
ncbi:peptidylprolyl isomerase [Pseudorhodoferax sp. LjRoot39]